MKKVSKKLLSLTLSIAIAMGTITASYASTELKDYGNEFVKINVKIHILKIIPRENSI